LAATPTPRQLPEGNLLMKRLTLTVSALVAFLVPAAASAGLTFFF